MQTNSLFNTKQAALYLGVSAAFLERDRWAGARIPFIKIGSRSIRYRLSDLDSFIDKQVRHSTSDEGIQHA
tara:strand:- start:51 stop:263 length:213 start_codon:yes stop_codon:yes gene_type:complete